jgi:hypothetical protein
MSIRNRTNGRICTWGNVPGQCYGQSLSLSSGLYSVVFWHRLLETLGPLPLFVVVQASPRVSLK